MGGAPEVLAGLAALLAAGFGGLRLTASCAADDAPALERWALGASLTVLLLAGGSALLLLVPTDALGLDGHAGARGGGFVVSAVLLAAGAWTARRAPVSRRASATAADRVVLVLAGAVFALFFVGVDDRAFTPWCLHRGLDYVLHGRLSGEPVLPGPSPLLRLPIHEHLGNVFLVYVPVALLPGLAERVASGTVASLLFLGLAALGVRVTGRRAPAVLLAAAFLLMPDVFDGEVLNVNLLAAWLAAIFLLVLGPSYRDGWFVRGLVAAFLVQSRYIALPGLAALALATWRDRGPGGLRAAAGSCLRVAGVFAVASLPTWATHVHLYGTPFMCAALREFPLYPYELLGVRFSYPGLLNAPLHDHLVRTPFNPYPMWLGWPLHVASQVGVVGVTLMLLGLSASVLPRHRVVARPLVLAAFVLPVAGPLLVQENWMEAEKLTIWLLLAPAFFVLAATGVRWLLELPRRRAVLVGLASLAVTGGAAQGVARGLAAATFPEDTRFREHYAGVPAERAETLQFLRERATHVRWLPWPDGWGRLDGLGRKLADAAGGFTGAPGPLRTPSVVQRLAASTDEALVADAAVPTSPDVSPEGPPGATRCLALDLSQSPTVAADPVRPCPPGPPRGWVTLRASASCAVTPGPGPRFPFLDRDAVAAACQDGDTAYVLVAPRLPPDADDPVRRVEQPRAELLAEVSAGLELQVPHGTRRVELFEAFYLATARIYRRTIELDAEGAPRVGTPRVFLHN